MKRTCACLSSTATLSLRGFVLAAVTLMSSACPDEDVHVDPQDAAWVDDGGAADASRSDTAPMSDVGDRDAGGGDTESAPDAEGNDGATPDETVGAPVLRPTPLAAYTGVVARVSVQSATSSLGHALERRFDIDGEISPWAPIAAYDHAWESPGSSSVRAQARCAAHPEVVSEWSAAVPVEVSDGLATELPLFPVPHQGVLINSLLAAPVAQSWSLYLGPDPEPLVQRAAERLVSKLAEVGATAEIVATEPAPATPSVYLATLASLDTLPAVYSALVEAGVAPVYEAQGYILHNDGEGPALIVGADPHGVLYGVTSLEQLRIATDDDVWLHGAVLRDWPDIKQRVWGKLDSFAQWEIEESYTATFEQRFADYLEDWLIPRRINVITEWLTYHSRHWDGTRYFEMPVIRERMELALQMARDYGVEYEYRDRTGVGWDEALSAEAPYDELIWHQDYFTCYSRDDLILATADEMGQFLADMGIRRIYIHQYDGPSGGWERRCSVCRAAYPDDEDPDKVVLAEAEAHLGNLYHRTLRSHVPDINFVMVQSLYDDTGTNGWPEHHPVLHQLLDPEVITIIRETGRATVETMRSYYPGRPLYTYIENDESVDWEPIFDLVARYMQEYDFHDDRDAIFVSPNANGDRGIAYTSYAYYAWNTEAPGADRIPHDTTVYNPKNDTLGLSDAALGALEQIVTMEHGAQWVAPFERVALTWLSRGLMVDPNRLSPGTWRWGRISRWFEEELAGLDDDAAWVELHRLHMVEAARVEHAYDEVFTTSVPAPWWRLYAYGRLTCLLAAPRYWEMKCRRQGGAPDPADVAAGLLAVDDALAALPAIEAKIMDSNYHGTQGWTYMNAPAILAEIQGYLESL